MELDKVIEVTIYRDTKTSGGTMSSTRSNNTINREMRGDASGRHENNNP